MASFQNMAPPQGQHLINNSRSQTISYADLMKPDEDWRMLPDAAERRRIQNRLAQRAYRRNMRDRTKELEKLKKELAQLKENKEPGNPSIRSHGRLSPRMTPPMQHQQRPMPIMATPDDFVFDGTMTTPQWAEPFPQAPAAAPQFNDQPLHIDPAFFISGTDATGPSLKRRRTNSTSSEIMTPSRSNSSLSVASQFRPGHQRSRSHTPLSSPPMVQAATPPPSTMAEIQQASQLLSLSPCNFDLAADTMTLPPLDGADSPPFTLDGFTDPLVGSGSSQSGSSSSFDQSLWTPPMPSSLYGSFLTPPTTDGGAASPPLWGQQSTPGSCSLRSESMGRSRSASASTASRASPFSSATSQFSSPSLAPATLAKSPAPPSGLNLNLDGCLGGSDNTAPPPSQTSSSLLHLAVAGGHTQVLQLLLQRCEVPINARDSAGYTALQRAVFAGRMEMVSMLLEAGADFSAGRQDDGAAAASEQQQQQQQSAVSGVKTEAPVTTAPAPSA